MIDNVIIENTEVTGWRAAIRGMRNPKNSWDRMDSDFSHPDHPVLGENDLKLCNALIQGGPVHRKFFRMIHVSADFTLPYYLVQEFDTYKVGTVRDSCSFMHKGTSREFTADDFVFDPVMPKEWVDETVQRLNWLRAKYLETKDMQYFRALRQLLPAGYRVKFTWDANYEVLLGIYKWRKDHRLSEWHDICDWIKSLPYMEQFIKAAGL